MLVDICPCVVIENSLPFAVHWQLFCGDTTVDSSSRGALMRGEEEQLYSISPRADVFFHVTHKHHMPLTSLTCRPPPPHARFTVPFAALCPAVLLFCLQVHPALGPSSKFPEPSEWTSVQLPSTENLEKMEAEAKKKKVAPEAKNPKAETKQADKDKKTDAETKKTDAEDTEKETYSDTLLPFLYGSLLSCASRGQRRKMFLRSLLARAKTPRLCHSDTRRDLQPNRFCAVHSRAYVSAECVFVRFRCDCCAVPDESALKVPVAGAVCTVPGDQSHGPAYPNTAVLR